MERLHDVRTEEIAGPGRAIRVRAGDEKLTATPGGVAMIAQDAADHAIAYDPARPCTAAVRRVLDTINIGD